MTDIAIEAMANEIVSFHSKKGDFPWLCSFNQRVGGTFSDVGMIRPCAADLGG